MGRGRGRGRGAKQEFSKDALDEDLDSYMSKAKASLDQQLESYMANADGASLIFSKPRS